MTGKFIYLILSIGFVSAITDELENQLSFNADNLFGDDLIPCDDDLTNLDIDQSPTVVLHSVTRAADVDDVPRIVSGRRKSQRSQVQSDGYYNSQVDYSQLQPEAQLVYVEPSERRQRRRRPNRVQRQRAQLSEDSNRPYVISEDEDFLSAIDWNLPDDLNVDSVDQIDATRSFGLADNYDDENYYGQRRRTAYRGNGISEFERRALDEVQTDIEKSRDSDVTYRRGRGRGIGERGRQSSERVGDRQRVRGIVETGIQSGERFGDRSSVRRIGEHGRESGEIERANERKRVIYEQDETSDERNSDTQRTRVIHEHNTESRERQQERARLRMIKEMNRESSERQQDRQRQREIVELNLESEEKERGREDDRHIREDNRESREHQQGRQRIRVIKETDVQSGERVGDRGRVRRIGEVNRQSGERQDDRHRVRVITEQNRQDEEDLRYRNDQRDYDSLTNEYYYNDENGEYYSDNGNDYEFVPYRQRGREVALDNMRRVLARNYKK